MFGHEPAWLAIRSLGLLALALLLGCTESERPAPAGGGAINVRQPFGAACTVDAECVAGSCHPERRVCVCTSDASCPALLQCDPFTGRCVAEPPGCTDDRDCGDGRWCDTSARTCRPIRAFCEPCERAQDCGPGNACVRPAGGGASFCGEACRTAADCSRPRTRCLAGQCVPQVDCADVAPCTPDSEASCRADADCPAGQSCDAAGVCRANDSGCAAGQRCDYATRECYASCGGPGDCAANERCAGDRCVPLPPCRSDADCPEPRVCRIDPLTQDGTCIVGCGEDDGCPLGSRCVARNGRTVCEPGCQADADCFLDQVCENGACVGGRCQTSDVCASCQRCDETHRCANAVRPGVPATAYCAPCGHPDAFDEAACGPGGYCDRFGACAPACPADGCPRGFACHRARRNDPRMVCFPIDDFCDTECS